MLPPLNRTPHPGSAGFQTWPALLLGAWLLAGCQSPRYEPPPLSEVTLSEARPYAMSSTTVDTNTPAPPAASPQAAPAPSPPKPDEPAWKNLPTQGWVGLEEWSQTRGLGQPRRVGYDTYAVATPRGTAVFHPGAQVVQWEGLNLWLGFAPRLQRGQVQVHGLDAAKTLDPLLRPAPPAARPGRVAVIDAGHGGADSGTQDGRGHLEKSHALDWALRLEPLLRARGWKVHLTRTNDQEVSLAGRVAVADCVNADLFISLHFNGLSAASSHAGVETFCTTPAGMPSTVTRRGDDAVGLAFPNNAFDRENLRWAARIHRELLAAAQAADGGVRRARFIAVLRGQRRPAVLVEGGFLSNPEEAGRIATGAYRQKLAEALARALE